jgi:tetratricopeptide (TPR) repeat protein/predicted Ser/Thr protein kinase
MSQPLPPHAVARLLRDAREEEGAPRTGVPERYRVVRELGRGAMGVVYEALDTALGRRVALKLLHASGDPELRARFAREAAAAARLAHPHIAAVYDAEEGCIAMQLVEGVPLSRHRDAGIRRLVAFVRDAAEAVHHAHEQGVIHRDLKPENLMVEGDRVLVTDFGLAKSAAGAVFTLPGRVLGTPAYMPPEQARGEEATPRSDVYGLGATLYDLLAGRPPFVGPDVALVLRKAIEEEPPPLRSLRPGIPRDLEVVVRTALAKDPGRRYASAREFAEDLGRWLRGDPVLARGPGFAYRCARMLQRRPALTAACALAASALVVAWVVALRSAAAEAASEEALQLSALVSAAIDDARLLARRHGETAEAEARLDHALGAVRAFLARHESARGRYLLGRLLRVRGHEDAAMAEIARALAAAPGFRLARHERGRLLAAQVSRLAAAGGLPADSPALPLELRSLREEAIAELAAAAGAPGLRYADALLAEAEQAWLSGGRARARGLFEELRRLDAGDEEALLGLSRLALAEGDGDAAWSLAMSAIDIYRGFGPAYAAREATAATAAGTSSAPAGRGGALVHGHPEGAPGPGVEASGDDGSSEALHLRGAARLGIADLDGALADFTEALRRDSRDAMAYGNRALVQARRALAHAAAGRDAESRDALHGAIADVTQAHVLDPRLAGALNNRAVFRVELARLAAAAGEDSRPELALAMADLEAALELAPRFRIARRNRVLAGRRLAECALRAGDTEEAARHLAAARLDLDRLAAEGEEAHALAAERLMLAALEARLPPPR